MGDVKKQIILGSIALIVPSAVSLLISLLMSKTKNERLFCYLLLVTSLTLCIGGITFLKLRNKLRNKLLDACWRGNTEKVKFLLKIGVSVKDWDGNTPLFLATEANHVKTVKLLLQHKANVNVRNRFGNTPLASAIKNGHIEIAVLLLEHGADITSESSLDKLAIFATRNGHTKVLNLLLNMERVSANLKNSCGDSLLHMAVEGGYVEAAKLLLEHGANVNFSHSRETPLHLAAANGQVEMVKLLIENGANVNAIGGYDYTPLHLAARGTGLNINSRWYQYHNNYDGGNRGGKYREVVELLIKNGANIDAKGTNDARPIHFAISSGLLEIAILLLKKGADANLPRRIVPQYTLTPMGLLLLSNIRCSVSSIDEYESAARGYFETFFTLLAFGAHLTEEHTKQINENRPYLKDCLIALEEIKKMPHLGKIIRGYGERNFKIILDYNKENNIKQLTQELQSIKRSYSSSRRLSFIPEILLDIVKYMMTSYMKTPFKIGALSGLICEAIHSELKKEVSLEDIVSPNVASMLSDQDAVNLSLVCKSVNCKANDRIKNMLLNQLEKVVKFADAEVSGPWVGG